MTASPRPPPSPGILQALRDGPPSQEGPTGSTAHAQHPGLGPMPPGEHYLPFRPVGPVAWSTSLRGIPAQRVSGGQGATLTGNHQVLGWAELSETARVQSPAMLCFKYDHN